MEFSTLAPSDAAAGFRVRGRNGAAVLLIHGFTSGPRSMRPWADALLAAGYTVSLPVLPGHGTRWEDLAATGHTAWTAAVEDEFDALAATHHRVFVAGLSMGGTLALHLGIVRAPAGIVLVNPALSMADRTAVLAGAIKRFVASVPAIANDIARPGQDEGAYPRTPVAAVHELRRLIGATRRRLDEVRAPVLAYRSLTDHVVSEPGLDALRRELVGMHPCGLPRLQLRFLERSYHVATLDYDADALFAGSVHFFDRLGGHHHG
ncbi:alpha/beta hydrolase [Arthrobacter sp. JSM 101049]|uniref:alpha/beta hydrolase n=1 Tax=Arthrobacter sp. JSM 101049 TaxID=929097 RepID=UPI003565962F